MTITDFTALGFEPVATKLHPPRDGVWGSTIFKRRRKDFHYSYYVASIHVRERSMLYGQPIPIRKAQADNAIREANDQDNSKLEAVE